MKFAVSTLGCKVNQYETSALSSMLTERGHVKTDGEAADVLIINTCTVTGESSRKSRQAIRRMHQQNSDALLVVCGCFSQISPQEVRQMGADIVYGSGDKTKLADDIEKAFTDRQQVMHIPESRARREFEKLPAAPGLGRTRAMLKIEDGCDNFCTYCIIPHARGPVRSLPPEDAVSQAVRLSQNGYSELVITGIEIASYGRDIQYEKGLAGLAAAVSEAAPDMRIRLGSLEPNAVSDEFCGTLKNINLCNHFHLSLQSGSDTVLKRMGRRYDTDTFYSAVLRLRRHFPDCGITCDLITGFPGETLSEHEETLEFIRKCRFSSMHIFPYSPRPGTPAAAMDGQIDKSEKSRRAREAQQAGREMEMQFLCSCIGKTLPVLFETEKDGSCCGHGDNYALVSVRAENLSGVMRNVKISGVCGRMLYGTVSEIL